MKIDTDGSTVVQTANARICVNEYKDPDGERRTSVSLTVQHLDETLTQDFPADGKPDARRTRFIIGRTVKGAVA